MFKKYMNLSNIISSISLEISTSYAGFSLHDSAFPPDSIEADW